MRDDKATVKESLTVRDGDRRPSLGAAFCSEDLPCACGNPAKWLFMPSSEMPEEDRWRCDEHVPRNCSFCNSDDDGKEHPKPWEPCVEWWYLPEDESSQNDQADTRPPSQ